MSTAIILVLTILASGAVACMTVARLGELPLHLTVLPTATLMLIAASWAAVVTSDPVVQIASLVLGWGLLVLSLIDARTLRLPDSITLPLTAAGLLAAQVVPLQRLADHLLGALVGYGVFLLLASGYRRFRARDGLGMGDAKLLAAGGAWLTWTGLPSVVLLASMAALVFLGLRRLLRRTPASEPMPFGPALALAIWTVWLHGPLGQFS